MRRSYLILALVACGCDALDGGGGTALAPELHPIDSLVLAEDQDAPIGKIRGFSIAESGEYLFADEQHGHVLVYARDGSLMRYLGRRGEGPGEWTEGPYFVFGLDAENLVVGEGTSFTGISFADGTEHWSRPADMLETLIQPAGGYVLSRAINRERRTTLARIRVTSSAGPVEKQQTFGGPFPFPLGRSNLLDRFLAWPFAGAYGEDSIAVAVSGSDFLFVGPFAGPFDSIAVPVRARRGAMPEVMAAVRDDDPSTMMSAAYRSSFPFNVAELAEDGLVALVLLDHDFPGNDSLEVAKLYLSVVDVPRRRACVDARIPAPTDPLSYTVIRGDTLFVLAQEVDRAGLRSQTVIRRYRVDTSDCAWLTGA